MKDLILMLITALLVFAGSIYVLCFVLCGLMGRNWFEIPDACGNVGEEDGLFTGDGK